MVHSLTDSHLILAKHEYGGSLLTLMEILK